MKVIKKNKVQASSYGFNLKVSASRLIQGAPKKYVFEGLFGARY